MPTKIWLKYLKGTHHLEGPSVDESKTLKLDARKMWFGGVDWTNLAQDLKGFEML
jgi:hypothetical protein